ncbi:MAG: aminotransferase class V-fold PLP-dependent enzyme [Armatimonadota bacterium]
MPEQEWDHEFPVGRRLIYLNHAGVCPLPARTARAIAEQAADYRDHGARHWARWSEVLARGRSRLAELMGAGAVDEVAYVRSTTAGLMVVAESIPWREGESVVVADIEFPANVYPWLNLRRRGVQTRFVPARERFPTVDDYRAACDRSTRVIAVSWVQFATGQRADLAGLAQLAHEVGAWLVVDAIQGLGALRMDVEALGVDVLCADGHKWLLSVEGAGALYVSSRLVGDLEPFWRGWTSVPEPERFLDYDQPARPDARRFEEGSPSLLGAAALDASVGLLLEVGPERIERSVLALTERIAEGVRALGCEVTSPCAAAQRSGIICFRHPARSADEIVAGLSERGIVAASRLGSVRFSPHFYITADQVDCALEAVARLL